MMLQRSSSAPGCRRIQLDALPIATLLTRTSKRKKRRGARAAILLSRKKLDTQCHDGVDDIVVVLLEGLDSLVAADAGLGHDELNVLVLDALGVNLLAVILLLLLLGVVGLVGVAVAGVVVAGVVVLGGALGGELGSGGLLSGSGGVLNLGLTEDAVRKIVSMFGPYVLATRPSSGQACRGTGP